MQQQQDNEQWNGFDATFFNSFYTPNNPRWQERDHAQDWSATQQQLSQQFNQPGWSTQDQHLYFHDSEGNLSARMYDGHGCPNAEGAGCAGSANEKFAFFYDYDENDRLTAAHEPQNLTTTYQWDAVGNLTHKQVRDLSYQYHYNDGNQLVQADHWRLRHSGAGNSRGNGPAYNHNGILSNWDIHHLDQQHLFEFMWDPSVNHNQERLTQSYQYNANGQLTHVNLGNGESEQYQHDALGRMTQQTTEYGAQYQFAYDAQDRRVSTQLSDWERSYDYQSLYDGRQENSQWDNQGNPYRTLNYLPGEQGMPYGTLISQNVHQWQNDEFRVTGFAQNYAETGYFHQDHLGSTVKITGPEAGNAFRWDYTPQGEAYGFTHRYSHEQMTRTHVGHSPKRHLVPYLYTGQYETNLTGLIHMDARWYNPQLGRWLQPDYYSFNQLALPQSARHQLLASTTLNTQQLLRDPSQQMAYGYVSGNPLRWVDPMGLCGWFWSNLGSSVKSAAIGAAETALVLSTGAASSVSAGLAGLGTYALTGDLDAATAVIQGIQAQYTYQPRSAQGQAAVQTLGGVSAKVDEGLHFFADPIADRFGPLAGTATYMAPDLLTLGTGALLRQSTRAGSVSAGLSNPIPDTLARVVPDNPITRASDTLGRPGADDVFVTAASDIRGLNASQIAERLTIPESPTGFRVIEFQTPSSGIASPVNRTDPGFIGGGRTAGGAREFVIPNGAIPDGSSTRVIP
ncbi:polymorphic toxin type 10 domain-containing protein [Salinispirillum marinum]|uniref:Polymorphic toxin type 10 domain-containing protein n=2 Tax=Saccharospirillaceae TaxID=255527 RepID=A0ABV8BBY1_9GAMM